MTNNVQLIGNLGTAPNVKNLEGGKKVATISIATTEKYTNSAGEKTENTQWHSCVAWGKTAEILEKYTEKGSKIAIQGKLAHRKYEDKEGIERYVTEVIISEVLLLDKK